MEIAQSRRARTAHPYDDTDVIDVRAPRTNQFFVAALSWAALATGVWWLAGLMGLQLAIGLTFGRRYCLTCIFYFEVVQPLFGEGRIEDSRPPRFANVIGAIFLNSASMLHLAGASTAGWVLITIVAALASLAVITGFCMGCSMYRVLARLRGVRPGHLDQVDLNDFGVTERDGIVIQFTHPLCSDCRELERELRSAGRAPVLVDVSKNPDLAHKYHVSVVPAAFEVTRGGKVAARLI